ncbi:hypothetical protein N9W21_02790 [Shewanella sp.]|nr:hypothetical protein [Shewanella sp.]
MSVTGSSDVELDMGKTLVAGLLSGVGRDPDGGRWFKQTSLVPLS